MSRITRSGVRRTMTNIVVAGALIAAIATGVSIPANAMPGLVATSRTPVPLGEPGSGVPSDPLDPLCAQMPTYPVCEGGPYWQQGTPISPDDPQCASMPGAAACAGSPYASEPPTDLQPPPAEPPNEVPQPPTGPTTGVPESLV